MKNPFTYTIKLYAYLPEETVPYLHYRIQLMEEYFLNEGISLEDEVNTIKAEAIKFISRQVSPDRGWEVARIEKSFAETPCEKELIFSIMENEIAYQEEAL